jgi:hypothetical protein
MGPNQERLWLEGFAKTSSYHGEAWVVISLIEGFPKETEGCDYARSQKEWRIGRTNFAYIFKEGLH